RLQSVHALQALTLINSRFMLDQSRALATSLHREIPADDSARIRRLFLLAINRDPNPKEMNRSLRFLREQSALIHGPDSSQRAWTDLCLATLNLNEFAYVR